MAEKTFPALVHGHVLAVDRKLQYARLGNVRVEITELEAETLYAHIKNNAGRRAHTSFMQMLHKRLWVD